MNREGRSASVSFWGQKNPPTATIVEFVQEPRIDAVFFVCVRVRVRERSVNIGTEFRNLYIAWIPL